MNLNSIKTLVVVDKMVKQYTKFIGQKKEFKKDGKLVTGELYDVYSTEVEMMPKHDFLCLLSTGQMPEDVMKDLTSKYKDITPSTRIGFYLYKIVG